MKKLYLITPISKDLPEHDEAGYIGVDQGAIVLLDNGIIPDLAIGDFDSLKDSAALLNLEKKNVPIIRAAIEKDETDLQLALMELEKLGLLQDHQVIVWDAIKGRLDHTLANLLLVGWQFPQVILEDPRQKVIPLLPGTYKIDDGYRHISFFALETSVISLEGFHYPLDHQTIYPRDIYCVSNSLDQEQAFVTLHKGRVLCICSNEP